MRVLVVVLALVIVLGAAAWGVSTFISGIIPNGPIATLLGKHKPIKKIIQHGGLPVIGKRPGAGACATPGTPVNHPLPPWARCGTPGPGRVGPGGGPPGGGPPGGGPPGR